MPVDFEERMLDKFDNIDKLLRDICERTTRMEVQLEEHFKDIDKREKQKDKKFYYLIALMGLSFTLFQIIKELL